jgi:NTE family protein
VWGIQGISKKNIRIDIAAGTSIGAVNAAIIVGSKGDYPEKDLEDFGIEIAESNLCLFLILSHLNMILLLEDT